MASNSTTGSTPPSISSDDCDGLYQKILNTSNRLISTNGFATAVLVVLLPLVGLVTLNIGLQGLEYSNSVLITNGLHSLLRGDRFVSRDVGSSEVGFEVPECAQDVFVTLHNNNKQGAVRGGSSSSSSCKGMLIRDDMILTTRECAKQNYTLSLSTNDHYEYVPSLGHPHTELNSKEGMETSHLGFLKTNAQPHYHFINESSYRTRMFLSLSSTNDNGQTISITCHGDKPILHNFPSLDKGREELLPLYDIHSILPHDILWEHLDLDTAPTLEYKSQRWWTKAIDRHDEERHIAQMLRKYEGPNGSVSVPAAHDKFSSQAGAFMEVVDPKGHRRGECFVEYYALWRHEKPFSRLHFFDWLDYGAGQYVLEDNLLKLNTNPKYQKQIKVSNHTLYYPTEFKELHNDMKCRKENFNVKTVHYFNNEERSTHEVYITPSTDENYLIWRYKHNNELVPPSTSDNPHLYMWGQDKKWYIVDNNWDNEKYQSIKHTAVLSGMPALSAGNVHFGSNGQVTGINFSSGHYRPYIQAVAMMYQSFKDEGYNLTATEWIGRTSWSEKDCNDTDWNSIDIPGFDDTAVALEQSCREVVNSPTWRLKEDD